MQLCFFFATVLLNSQRIMSAVSLTATPEYKALETHMKKLKELTMRDMFEKDPKRFDEFRYVCVTVLEQGH